MAEKTSRCPRPGCPGIRMRLHFKNNKPYCSPICDAIELSRERRLEVLEQKELEDKQDKALLLIAELDILEELEEVANRFIKSQVERSPRVLKALARLDRDPHGG